MNSRKFLSLLLLLVILLITVVKAEEKESHVRTHRQKTTSTSIDVSASTSIPKSTSSAKHLKSVEEDEEDEEGGEDEDKEDKEDKNDDKEPGEQHDEPKVTTTTEKTTTTTTTKTSSTTKTTTTTVTKTTVTSSSVSKVSTTTKISTSSVVVVPTTTTVTIETLGTQDVPIDAPVSNAVAAPVMNPIAPSNNGNSGNSLGSSPSSNISTDNSAPAKEESGSNNKVVKISVISIVAVGAVVGVATIGVHAYNKKSSDDREINMADIEAQPISYDFGKTNNELSHMPVEECNPYNIMNENNRLYMNNNPYEYKPNFDNFETTPFDKVETVPNEQYRESIFSNNENNAQPVGNEVYNFNEKQQLPYVQGLPVENGFIETPVANEIEVENYDMQNNQMPTLVPVEPEIIITKPDEEQANAQDGYKQIVPTVAKMEIIETPDFNNMTTSMIEDHINNMDLENLASLNSQPQTQTQQEQEAGYKEIVPDIQEAVIENFDIEDDQEQEFSAVDNITDTYRAALRATYCSTTDENRFSYRTVDSDHSLLHTMREEANW